MLNRHLLTYLPMYMAQIIVGFGTVVVFTRLLSPKDYGLYVILLSSANLASTFIYAWLDAAVVRYEMRARLRSRTKGHLFTAFSASFILTFICLVGLLGLLKSGLLPSHIIMPTLFAGIYLIVRSSFVLCIEMRRAQTRARRASLLDSFTTTWGFALGIGITSLTDLGAAGPFAGLILAMIVAFIVDGIGLIKQAKADRAQRARLYTYFMFGLPVALSLIFENLLTNGDRLLIAAFLGEEATGAYAAGYAIADRSIYIVFLWLGASMSPLLIQAVENQNHNDAKAIARNTARLMGLLGIPAAIGLFLIADPIAGLLIGENIRGQAAQIIPIISVSAVFNGIMTFYFHEAFILGQRTKVMAFIMAMAALVNLSLNLIMIPAWGIIGAAYATLIAYALALTSCIIIGRRMFIMPIPTSDWLYAGIAGGGMASVLVLLPSFSSDLTEIIVKISLGILSYSSFALILNIADCRSFVINTYHQIQQRVS